MIEVQVLTDELLTFLRCSKFYLNIVLLEILKSNFAMRRQIEL
jgi:hypothetical protein